MSTAQKRTFIDELTSMRDSHVGAKHRSLGRLLGAARGALRLTAKTVAAETGLMPSTVRATEVGDVQPNRTTVRILGRFYADRGIAFEIDLRADRYAVRVDTIMRDGAVA
jgi:DNA-binding XRE family transcriptional regulator